MAFTTAIAIKSSSRRSVAFAANIRTSCCTLRPQRQESLRIAARSFATTCPITGAGGPSTKKDNVHTQTNNSHIINTTATTSTRGTATLGTTTVDLPPSTSSDSSANKREPPSLVIVPSLPYIGSLLPSYSDTPEYGSGKDFNFWVEMRKKFGNFYSFGLPGLGADSHGTVHVITNPIEMAKVIRSEGKYPSGAIQLQWAIIAVYKSLDGALVRGDQDGFFGRSTDWKRIRSFLQTDLLNPSAADGYLDGVIQAAEIASKGVPSFAVKQDMNGFLNHAAFDMFCTVMFGEMVQTSNPDTPTLEEDSEFIEAAITFISMNNKLNISPYETILNKIGIESSNFQLLKRAVIKTNEISTTKAYRFMKKKQAGETDEIQDKSWLSHAMERQSAKDSHVTEEEMIALVGAGLSAAVDTTSGFLSWILLHLSLNPTIQERLYNDLQKDISKDDSANGRLTSDIVKNNLYLNAIIRESHRLTPNAPLSIFKQVSKDITIHNQDFLAGTVFIFDSFSTGKDPNIVDDPETYMPERWLPEQVAGRKNTPKAVIDNIFYKEPFSQGARKCPGSRVANNEVHALIAQLVLDWKMRVPDLDSYKDVPYSLQGTVTPELPNIEFLPRM